MKLAPNFTTHEMVRSSRFPRLETPWDDIPSRAAANLSRLVTCFLQPLRDEVGVIEILSGYRGPALNDAVGGVEDSRHRLGLAADFIPREADAELCWDLAIRMPRVTFDRLTIYTGLDPVTFHVDLRLWEEGEMRRRLYRDSPWQRLTEEEALALQV